MICTSCNKEKDKSEFYTKGKQCKDCIKEKRKKRYENKKVDEMNDKIHVLDFTGNENENEENNNHHEIFDGLSNTMISEMLDDSLNSVFKLLSKRLGKHWKLDEGEATSISKPAINILSKSTFYSKLMENADIVALTGALSFVLLPRIFVTINENKNVKEENINDRRENNIGEQKTENKTDDKQNDNENEYSENLFDDYEPVNF